MEPESTKVEPKPIQDIFNLGKGILNFVNALRMGHFERSNPYKNSNPNRKGVKGHTIDKKNKGNFYIFLS